MRQLAPRLGFLDRPGGHKGHLAPTPLGGGVAIWLTTVGILGLGILIMRSWAQADFPAAARRDMPAG